MPPPKRSLLTVFLGILVSVYAAVGALLAWILVVVCGGFIWWIAVNALT